MSQIVTRSVLKDAIEEGILKANLDTIPANALRKVGDKAVQIAVGDFGQCGCPLTQAGLYTSHGEPSPIGESLGINVGTGTHLGSRASRFYLAFDKAVGQQSGVYDVVEKEPEDYRTYLAVPKARNGTSFIITVDLSNPAPSGRDVPAKKITNVYVGDGTSPGSPHSVSPNSNQWFYGVDSYNLTEITGF